SARRQHRPPHRAAGCRGGSHPGRAAGGCGFVRESSCRTAFGLDAPKPAIAMLCEIDDVLGRNALAGPLVDLAPAVRFELLGRRWGREFEGVAALSAVRIPAQDDSQAAVAAL